MKSFMSLILATMTLLATTAALADVQLTCTGYKREATGMNQSKETTVQLDTTMNTAGYLIMKGVIDDRAFAVSRSGEGGDYILSITNAPDYLNGVIATTQLTSNRRLQVTTISGAILYKLECKAAN